jgi:hypothetical protein
LSDVVERFAIDYLKNEDARVTFRLFLVGHGTTHPDRIGVKPIFSTTCGIRSGKDRKPFVVERNIDENLAMCRRSGGCARCQ